MRSRMRKVFTVLTVTVIISMLFCGGKVKAVGEEATMPVIMTSLFENGKIVVISTSNQDVGKILEDIGNIKIGKKYEEQMWIKNPDESIDQYCRVIIYKYWVDSDGTQRTDLSPDLIEINYSNSSDWMTRGDLTTIQREEFIYNKPVKVGNTTLPFIESISINPLIYENVELQEITEGGKTTLVPKCLYDGCSAYIEIEVDATQTHNAADAIKDAWGVSVELSADGRIIAIKPAGSE